MMLQEFIKERLDSDSELRGVYGTAAKEKVMLANLIDTIVNIRKEKQLTQKELASILDTKQSYISRFENKFNFAPRMDTFIQIINALDCDIEIVSRHSKAE